MIYQGEDIIINISGNEGLMLSETDFLLVISENKPSQESRPIVKEKKEASEQNGIYTFIISAEESAGLKSGQYDLEVLIKAGTPSLVSIYKKANAFFLRQSVSKSYLSIIRRQK